MTTRIGIYAIAAVMVCGTLAQGANTPLKVYVLAGQSNMQGHGQLRTMPYMAEDPKTKPLHDKIIAANGKPRLHKNVRIAAYSEYGKGENETKSGPLTMGYGASLRSDTVCGPELGFGITIGERLGEPVLLIKTAWGGKSLNTDFRPPSAGAYKLPAKTQELWDKYPNGAHGIPSKAKRREWWDKKNKATGHYYRLMVNHVNATLADIKKYHPDYDAKEGYELAGMVWFQGWNDMCDGTTYPDNNNPNDSAAFAAYTEVMGHFIRDVRKEFNAPQMKVVIGVIGVNGDKATGAIANLRSAMTMTASIEEFKGNVVAVHTGDFWDHPMAALEDKKRMVDYRMRSAHVFGNNGLMEPRDTSVPGWELVGAPAAEERIWRFTTVDATVEKEKLEKKHKKRFRKITLPAELADWFEPGFDDSKWQSGKAPIGKGIWKEREYNIPIPQFRSQWGDGEFILARTTFEVDKLNHDAYRIAVLANQGYDVYLNGVKMHTYIWWKEPMYRSIVLEDKYAGLLRKGTNVLAVRAGSDYSRGKLENIGAIDVVLEGITKKGIEYVNSEKNILRLKLKECTREEVRIMNGMCNGGFHYLGSGKMLCQIGEAFAEAMIK